MKMTKSLLIGAVAFAAVLFAGCEVNWSLDSAMQRSIGTDFFSYNSATKEAGMGTWTFDEVNDNSAGTNEWVRGGKLLFTKHHDMKGVIRLQKISNGVTGIMFNVKENTGKYQKGSELEGEKLPNYGTYNFCLASFVYDGGVPKYYVSYFCNINEEDMGKRNFGAHDGTSAITKTTYDKNCYTPYEIDYTNGILNLSGNYNISNPEREDEKNAVGCFIDVKETDDGGYDINFYEFSKYDTKKFKLKPEVKADANVKISAESLGKIKKTQAYLGIYSCIYEDSNMAGTLEILGLTKEAIEIEE